MRRLLALASLFVLALPLLGCGYPSYEARLEATQRRLKDDIALNKTLYSAAQGAFAENNIYLRVPQGLAQRPDFELIQLNPGYFEVEASFNPQGGDASYNLHVLARRDAQDPPEEQAEQPPVPRGDFRSDVLGVLSQVYGPEVNSAPIEQVNKSVWPRSDSAQSLSYELLSMTDSNQRLIQIYFYSEQSGNANYDAALIWEFPSGAAPTGSPNPVDLTLGTFAVGQRAAARFSGRPDSVAALPGDGSVASFERTVSPDRSILR